MILKILVCFFMNIILASDYSDFYNTTDKSLINAFAKDMSFITTSSIFYSGRTLGFGGFSVNYKNSYLVKNLAKNSVIKEKESINISFIQIETGLPYRIDSFLRAGWSEGYSLIGGGIKYGLKNVTDELYGINIVISFYSHMGLYKHFYILSFGSQLLISTKISNYLMPFIGGGFENSKFVVKSHSDSTLIGDKFYNTLYKGICGLRFKFGWFNFATSYEIYNLGPYLLSGTAGIRF
ncbi:MAG: hypothetical protein N2Z20_02915 [Elusimicrobiales bacterium]|nr:hypothetical protein [Elusimicrobiales bacterium]